MNENKSCNLVLNDLENVLIGVGECFDTLIDERQGKMEVIGSLFKLGKKVGKLGLDVGACAIRNTPKAVVTVAKVKREITETLTEEYYKIQKEIETKELEESIRKIKQKRYN